MIEATNVSPEQNEKDVMNNTRQPAKEQISDSSTQDEETELDEADLDKISVGPTGTTWLRHNQFSPDNI